SRNLHPERLSDAQLLCIRESQLPPKLSSLQLKLLGTIAVWDRRYSVASILDSSANLSLPVKIGEIFNDKIQILDIETKKVVFKPMGPGASCQKEFIEIPED